MLILCSYCSHARRAPSLMDMENELGRLLEKAEGMFDEQESWSFVTPPKTSGKRKRQALRRWIRSP